ncbi:MAG: putative ABC exporter domain-containing protein, partial [Gammaproteobacteria bacterium]
MTRTLDALLFKLLLLRLRGGVRQRLQEFKTPRGLLFLLVTLAVIALLILQPAGSENPLAGLLSRDKEQLRNQIGQFMPTGLLATYLLTVFISPSPGIYFSPSEINLLFSAPFTRRALLLYKIGSYAFGVLLSSLLIMLLTPASAYSPAATFFGAFLTLMFIQLLTVATTLLVQVSRGYIGYLPAVMLISLAAATVWSAVDGAGGITASLTQFQSSRAGSLILAPFTVFARIFLAPSFFPDVLAWASLGLAMNGGLIALAIRLDRHVSEASTAASLKLHTRWDRARRGGLPWGPQFSTVHSFMPPPVLGGIGPLVWRQMLS